MKVDTEVLCVWINKSACLIASQTTRDSGEIVDRKALKSQVNTKIQRTCKTPYLRSKGPGLECTHD